MSDEEREADIDRMEADGHPLVGGPSGRSRHSAPPVGPLQALREKAWHATYCKASDHQPGVCTCGLSAALESVEEQLAALQRERDQAYRTVNAMGEARDIQADKIDVLESENGKLAERLEQRAARFRAEGKSDVRHVQGTFCPQCEEPVCYKCPKCNEEFYEANQCDVSLYRAWMLTLRELRHTLKGRSPENDSVAAVQRLITELDALRGSSSSSPKGNA